MLQPLAALDDELVAPDDDHQPDGHVRLRRHAQVSHTARVRNYACRGQASTTTATDQRKAGWPSFAHQRSGDQDISSQYKPEQQSVKEQVLPASFSHAPALAASASSIAPPVSSSCAQPLPMAARRCSATARRSNGRVKCARSQRGPFPAGRPAARNDTRRLCWQ